jgi:hypothetical protein
LTGGKYDVSLDADKLPDDLAQLRNQMPTRDYSGDLFDALANEGFADADGRGPSLVTIRVDGQWYVSLFASYLNTAYGNLLVPSSETAAEMRDEGVRAPDPDAVSEDVTPIVGANVDEVLDNLSSAIAAGDLDRLLANLPDDEVRALQPFAGTAEDILRNWGATFTAEVDNLDVDTTDEGDFLRVVVHSGTAQGSFTDTDDGYTEGGSARLSGTCGYATGPEGYEDGGCLPGTFTDVLGVDEAFLLLRKVDDGYQLDPIATAAAYAQQVVESVPDRVVDDLVAAINAGDEYQACYALGLGDDLC